jgi:hypothetical protein
MGHVHIIEEHGKTGPCPNVDHNEGEKGFVGAAKPLEGQGVEPQGSEGYIDCPDVWFQHTGKNSADDGQGQYRGQVQNGPEKRTGKNFPVDNVGNGYTKNYLGKHRTEKENKDITKNLKHYRIFQKQPEIFHAGKDFVPAHTIPFKGAVVKVKEQRINTEDGKEKENGDNKKISFILIMNFVDRFGSLQGDLHFRMFMIIKKERMCRSFLNS